MSSTLCLAWGAVPPPQLPSPSLYFPGLLGAHTSPGFKSVAHPSGFWGSILASWPYVRSSSPGTVPPLPRSWGPCPFLTPASLPLPFTCRAWLGAAPSKQERQSRAGERPSVWSQTHLLDPPPLGRSLCLSFPSVIHSTQCLELGRSSVSLAFLPLWVPLGF